MEEMLIVVFQFIIEIFVEAIANIPFDWPSKNRKTPESDKIFLSCFGWLCFGGLLSWGSLFFIKKTLIKIGLLRVVNLFIAPLLSGWISYVLASNRSRNNGFIKPKNHFWQAFWFTLGLAVVRFAYAKRV
jgi:hypothetical protein